MRSLVTIGFVATLAIATLSTVSYAQGDARRGAEARRGRVTGARFTQVDTPARSSPPAPPPLVGASWVKW